MRRVNVAEIAVEYDPEDPEGFRSGAAPLRPALGAEESGATVYQLGPGQAICPYHYEHAEEEWLLVLAGRPTLRTPEGETGLVPFDLVFFPRGPEGAHGVRNRTDEPVRVLMLSTVRWPAATTYPDSDKIGVFPEPGAGTLFRRSSAVPYFDGEA